MGHVLIVPSRAGWVCKLDDIGADDNTDMTYYKHFWSLMQTKQLKPTHALHDGINLILRLQCGGG